MSNKYITQYIDGIPYNLKKPFDFSFLQIKQYEKLLEIKRENSFSEMLDIFFTRKAQEQRIAQRCSATLKLMTNARDRIIRKLAAQKEELEKTSKRDHLRECGNLITANIHSIKKGQHTVIAEDFYLGNGSFREIKLDPQKSPQQNAAKYYKAYTKARNADKFLADLIKNGKNELIYIESVIEQIQRVENEKDLTDIQNELIQTGYIKKKSQQKQTKLKQPESVPHCFQSTSGMLIYAGKNNIQNDKLTLKTASKTDIWLHAQKIQGAHVIISCSGIYPDEKTLYEAASIAAFYSAAGASRKVPVDFTSVKNVKKPSGSKPGMVIYTDYQTLNAVPDEDLVKRLRKEN